MSKKLSILLIEDSLDDADIIVRHLVHAGYDVATTRISRRVELDNAIAGGVWDLVISDFLLPDFNGLDVLRLFRKHDPETPFVFVSGVMRPEYAEVALKHGANAFVRKEELDGLTSFVHHTFDV